MLERRGASAVRDPQTRLCGDGSHEVYYIPFESVEAGTKLVLVGITPGNTQIKAAYHEVQALRRSGGQLSDDDILRRVRKQAAFKDMRPRLIRMLAHFGLRSHLGIACEADLWGNQSGLLHGTSIVPHAAFAWKRKIAQPSGGSGRVGETRELAMFNGSFATVMASAVLRPVFERCFARELALLPPDAAFLALGPTPLEGLDLCVKRGLLRPEQVLGGVPHPSGNSGNQVEVFLGEVDLDSLNPQNPVRYRLPWLKEQARRVDAAARRLGCKPAAKPIGN